MQRFISIDDFIEIYTKLRQRGSGFLFSKLNTNDLKRAKSAFNHEDLKSANWWDIPRVTARWDQFITGNETLSTEQFIAERFLKGKKNLKMLSLGSGNCYSELKLAEHFSDFDEILCVDIGEVIINKAKTIAKEKKLTFFNFKVSDVNSLKLKLNAYDIIYFRSSLHHLKNVDDLLQNRIKPALKKDGLLIINEYVGPNRLQLPNTQIKEINNALKLIPKPYRKRYKLNLFKNKFHGAGLLRMVIADPSECVESALILPSLQKHFKAIMEVGYGGNILAFVLKDIAHHFVNETKETNDILTKLFKFEDDYLKDNTSNFVFGVYKK